ncbi:hydrogenase membrane subunit [Candidatus Woesearchaeota archaeon]|nr:hydrogenase membrane subunit [Candidatus Woesearchaeota archaeon]
MILQWFVLATLAAVLLILISRSHKRMNFLTIIHSLVFMGLTIYLFATEELPTTYFSSAYFLADHLVIYESLIAGFIFFLSAVYALGYIESLLAAKEMSRKNIKLFYISFNVLLLVIILAFFSNNLALFWVFLELTTLLSAVLVVTLNAKENVVAALEYIFIASTAMLFSLIGLILLFAISQQQSGTGTINWTALLLQASSLSPPLLLLASLFIFVGFAAKSGLVPFHTWLPYTHSKAPSAVSVILSASILNVGMYGLIRLSAVMQHTTKALFFSWVIMIFGLLSIAVAGFVMLQRTNLKKVIAYSSIEHNGFMLLAIGLGTPLALFWVLFYLLAHSLTKALLFFSAGIVHRQYDLLDVNKIKNLLTLQPVASWGLILGGVAIIGMPPFALFLGKVFIVTQIGSFSPTLLVVTLLLLLLVAGAFASFVTKAFAQNDNASEEKYNTPITMKFPIIFLLILLILLFFLGLFPESWFQTFLWSIVQDVSGGIIT